MALLKQPELIRHIPMYPNVTPQKYTYPNSVVRPLRMGMPYAAPPLSITVYGKALRDNNNKILKHLPCTSLCAKFFILISFNPLTLNPLR